MEFGIENYLKFILRDFFNDNLYMNNYIKQQDLYGMNLS